MKTYEQKKENLLKLISKVLSRLTGNDVDEIMYESRLEEDLGINLEVDFPRILKVINKKVSENDIDIHLQADSVLDLLEGSNLTIEELIKIIIEEQELG